ncbi:MAG: mechanosensitive ion channel family protein [Cyanothece sp. SIO1E1]|nr:mechanosensitive ion channel family protein [Cyanothece sp. SIO1E1]
MDEWMKLEFLQNSVRTYLTAIGMFIVGILVTKVLQSLILKRLKIWAQKTRTKLDDELLRILEIRLIPLVYLGVFFVSIQILEVSSNFRKALDVVGIILLTLFVVRLLGALVEYAVKFYLFTQHQANPGIEQSLNALVPAMKIVIWAIGVVFLLDNLDFDVSAAVTSLGIGGVAIALASQGILQDLFSYFSILFDRPFEIGDFIITGDYVGTVEYVGIKTTRIRSLDGEQIILTNSDLISSRIRNYKRMRYRRIAFTIGVTYETDAEKLQKIPEIIKDIIEKTDNVVFDRAHFLSYGDFSLNFEIVYNVNSNDYVKYTDAQQHINFALKQEFERLGIEFAYPTQVIYAQN